MLMSMLTLSQPMAVVLAITIFAEGNTAAAQGSLDRSLTSRSTEGRDHATDIGRRGILAIGPESTTVLKASWLLQPLASVSKRDYDVGLLGGYQNTNRFSGVPWQIDLRGLRRSRGNVAHGRWQ